MLSDEKIKEIKKILKKEEAVQVAYLYGSYARGTEHGESDVDIGVLVSEDWDYAYRDAVRTSLNVEEKVGKEVNIEILNGKDPRFLHNMLEDAKVIFSRDEGLRESFEANTLTRYLDMRPYIERHDRNIKRRMVK